MSFLTTLAGCCFVFAAVVGVGLWGPQLLRQLGGPPEAVQIDRVIDGDTVVIRGGERIRILNIDTAEIPPNADCAQEAALAIRARARLSELVAQSSSVALVRSAFERDRDVYGRLLRKIEIDGADVGQTLIGEGLAQPWAGRPSEWCG